MYKKINIKNFKCFKELTVEDLGRINLIVGKNNIGKTSLLEALFIHAGAYNPELTIRINLFRGLDIFFREKIPWDNLFLNFQFDDEINISGTFQEDNKIIERSIKINQIMNKGDRIAFANNYAQQLKLLNIPPEKQLEDIPILEFKTIEDSELFSQYIFFIGNNLHQLPPISKPVPFVTILIPSARNVSREEISDRFSRLIQKQKKDIMVNALKIIEPRLKDLFILTTGGIPILHGDIGLSQPIPLSLIGGGITNILIIFLSIMNAGHGVVLIDEIENGIHFSVLKNLWEVIVKLSDELDVQIFATTHSNECILAAHRFFLETSYKEFKLHRLEYFEDNIMAITYNSDSIESTFELGLEIRE
ncbi:MAG TPA: AAA family ATPase [Syntrophorhabdaceae bacterium]|nr:AAA family ATPase [Syntrophorhabdaceae bacterium]HQH43021.1 AAA family ATPase [Syntrophorhabdaceae bacterium]HQK45874.1 AAA family ATPase [Syntrophorhabdaceae bacterium]HRV22549.1 AAA family ATPase [Syntrophorhabdaceae bacterium]